MERKINCDVLTPSGTVFKGELDFAVIPAFDGEMGFLYNHAPLIGELGIGELRLRNGQDIDYIVVESGFVEISDNQLNVFAENAYKKEDLVQDDIRAKIEELNVQRKEAHFDITKRSEIENEIGKLKVRLKVASK